MRFFRPKRAVSQYHAPIELLDDPEAITELLGHTEQTFDRVETLQMEKSRVRVRGCTHPEAFFANLSLKCTTINWTADIPRSLDLLLNAKGALTCGTNENSTSSRVAGQQTQKSWRWCIGSHRWRQPRRSSWRLNKRPGIPGVHRKTNMAGATE